MNTLQELAYLATSDDAEERRLIRAGLPHGTCVPFDDDLHALIIREDRRMETPTRRMVWKERLRGLVTY